MPVLRKPAVQVRLETAVKRRVVAALAAQVTALTERGDDLASSADLPELAASLRQTGFEQITVHRPDGEPLRPDSRRMLIVASSQRL